MYILLSWALRRLHLEYEGLGIQFYNMDKKKRFEHTSKEEKSFRKKDLQEKLQH